MSDDFPHIAGQREEDEAVPQCLCGNPAEGRPHLEGCPFGQWLATHEKPAGAVGSGPDEILPNEPVDIRPGQCHCEEILFAEATEFDAQAAAYPADSAAARVFGAHALFLRAIGERIVARRRLVSEFNRGATD